MGKPAFNPHHILTPEALRMVESIHRNGSMAGAARELGLVPSALTYRVRQLENALDALLIDRRYQRARLTDAGVELLQEGQRLLQEMDAVVRRVKRVASGWETTLSISVDSIIARKALFDLLAHFYTLDAPTKIRLRSDALQGTWQALHTGQADLLIGAVAPAATPEKNNKNVQSKSMGTLQMVFAVAPQHPLAQAPEPLSDGLIAQYRAVAVADTSTQGTQLSIGLLAGQDVLTVPTMNSKIQAQLHGLGCGFVPACQVRNYVQQGSLVVKKVQRPNRVAHIHYAWRKPAQGALGLALQWWVSALNSEKTQESLMSDAGGGL